jgi:APA family basic amino acid/polyamine antiporter
LTLINMANIRLVGAVQLITTMIKLIPLLLMAVVGIFYINPENLMHFNVSGESNIKALLAASSITLWTFTGFESATIPAERVENPTKLIPVATILGTLIVVLVYILSAVAVMGIIPFADLAHSTAPYADAAGIIFGHSWGKWIAIAALIAVFGELNGWVLLQGEMPLAAARDGMFPKVFAKTSRTGAPFLGLIISSLLVSALLLLRYNASLVDEFTFIILLATFAALIPYIHTSLAELFLLLNSPEQFDRKTFIKAGLIALVAFVYSFWAIIGSGQEIVYYGLLLYFTGIPFYFWVKRSHS